MLNFKKIILLTAFSLVACSASEVPTSQQVLEQTYDKDSVVTSASKPSLVQDKRVGQYLNMMEEALNTTTLFYSRVSPEVASKIMSVKLPPDAKDVVKCLVNEVKAKNLNSQFDESLRLNKKFLKYIKDTPSLTIMTLESDSAFQDIQSQMTSPEFEPLSQIGKDCGVLDLNMKLSMQTGVMEAFKYLPED